MAETRADAALEALVRAFWVPGEGAFRRSPGGPAADYWISSQALEVALDGLERTGDPRWRDLARAFVVAQDRRGWSRDFLDDENWMALALLRMGDLTRDPSLHARAGWLLDDVAAGWDDACCGSRPGGIWWDRARTQKATASNAGPVITAARLYVRTGDARRLAFARRAYAYWESEMVDPGNGQVADHLEPGGARVWWRFSYNEGTMIGAAMALYEATGEAAYLEAARRTARFVLAHETASTRHGDVLSDPGDCSGDCEQFKGVAQRYLAGLAEVDPLGGWDALVRDSGEAIWDLGRDPTTTLFGVDWAAPPVRPTLATQASATAALALAARVTRARCAP